ncbi:MAG: redoxin domain-containing protein [Thermoleophilia bacterium]|nr:redoxin domain-containing protein [Thermoleophilia bacterium]
MGYDFGVGRQAPTLALAALDGTVIDLHEYRGDWFPVLVFFSADSAAAPAQLKALAGRASAFWGLRGQLIGVTGGDSGDPEAFAAAVGGLPFPIVRDDGSTAAGYGAARAVVGEAPPLAVIVDRAGKVVWMGEGDEDLKPAALLGALRATAR